MRIKLDENLPANLAVALRRLGHDVDTIHDERLTGSTDEAIWSAAQQAERFLITQDLDFSDLRKFMFGRHCGILLVRLREPGGLALSKRIEAVFRDEDVDLWRGCFIVVTEHKLRVRRPDQP